MGSGAVLPPHGSVSSATGHTLAIPVVSPVNIILESSEQQIIVTASSCAARTVLRATITTTVHTLVISLKKNTVSGS